jgi:hypothetical protein
MTAAQSTDELIAFWRGFWSVAKWSPLSFAAGYLVGLLLS